MAASEDQLKAWMLGGLAGDPEAQAALLTALVPLLRSFYRRRVRCGADDIEDLVQETLIAVHERRATYDRDRAFTAWLFAIARYKMIDQFRRVARFRTVEDFDTLLVSEGFEDESSARIDVDRLLDGLPIKQARAIRDTHLEGFSVAESAAHTGLGISDVKVSVHRGLKALAARFRGGS